MQRQKMPDDMAEFMATFTELCEKYADDEDEGQKDTCSKEKLLDFCHSYAYKVNGLEPWT